MIIGGNNLVEKLEGSFVKIKMPASGFRMQAFFKTYRSHRTHGNHTDFRCNLVNCFMMVNGALFSFANLSISFKLNRTLDFNEHSQIVFLAQYYGHPNIPLIDLIIFKASLFFFSIWVSPFNRVSFFGVAFFFLGLSI